MSGRRGRAKTALSTVLALLATLTACGGDEPPETPPAARESVPPNIPTVGGIQARDTEIAGLVADLVTATRQEGRLTVAVRFRNTGTDTLPFSITADGGTYPSVRLLAGGRAWPIARDEAGDLQAPESFERRLAPGQSMLWRAVFEAPPPEIGRFDLAMPGLRVPFRDVPINDRSREPTLGEELERSAAPQEP